MPGPSTDLPSLLREYYGGEPPERDWFSELPRQRQATDVTPDPEGWRAVDDFEQQLARPREQEPQQGRLPTSAERAEQYWRGEIARKAEQPWWSAQRNAWLRPDANSTAADVFRALTLALAGARPASIYGAVPGGMPEPFTLPGLPKGPGQQPLHYDGALPRTALAPLGAYEGKARPYEGPPPSDPAPLPPRIPGPLDDNGREVVFPVARPHQPSLLSQIAPQFVRDHIDLDNMVENPGYHARHIADPLIATWGLGMPGAEGAAALNALTRAWGRLKPGLGESTVETLRGIPTKP